MRARTTKAEAEGTPPREGDHGLRRGAQPIEADTTIADLERARGEAVLAVEPLQHLLEEPRRHCQLVQRTARAWTAQKEARRARCPPRARRSALRLMAAASRALRHHPSAWPRRPGQPSIARRARRHRAARLEYGRWRASGAGGWRRSWRRTLWAIRAWSAPTRRAPWRACARCSARRCIPPSRRTAAACSSCWATLSWRSSPPWWRPCAAPRRCRRRPSGADRASRTTAACGCAWACTWATWWPRAATCSATG